MCAAMDQLFAVTPLARPRRWVVTSTIILVIDAAFRPLLSSTEMLVRLSSLTLVTSTRGIYVPVPLRL